MEESAKNNVKHFEKRMKATPQCDIHTQLILCNSRNIPIWSSFIKSGLLDVRFIYQCHELKACDVQFTHYSQPAIYCILQKLL